MPKTVPHPVLVVAVVGPTATGKSDLAMDLAERLGPGRGGSNEIVNADAYQLYRGMDVGTAKVPVAERRGISHRQIDVIDPSGDASVARYQEAARRDLAEVSERGGIPVVVGGSGLYVRALLDEMTFPGTDSAVRGALEEQLDVEGARALFAELGRLDPAAADAIGPRNARRIVRALEVIRITGKPYTANLPRQVYVRPTVQIGLDCSREVLDRRVAARVDAMWEAGLVDEVRELAESGLGRTARRAVGYAEVLAHLEGTTSEQEARDSVVTNTRRLARKQMGWFGRDPRVRWLSAGSDDLVEQALAVVADARDGDQGLIDGPVRRSLGS